MVALLTVQFSSKPGKTTSAIALVTTKSVMQLSGHCVQCLSSIDAMKKLQDDHGFFVSFVYIQVSLDDGII
jgi:hypothetical protein